MFLLKVFVTDRATASVAFAQANARVSGTVTDRMAQPSRAR